MTAEQQVKWGYHLIQNFAELAAIFLRNIIGGRFDSKKYLTALQREGWSINPNGSCQVMSLKFESPEQRRDFEDKYVNYFSKIRKKGRELLPGESDTNINFRKNRPILSDPKGRENNTLIIPESQYAIAYNILSEMGLSHALEGYPTKETVSCIFDTKEEAENFAEKVLQKKISKSASVRHDLDPKGRYTVILPKIDSGKDSDFEKTLLDFGIDEKNAKERVISTDDKIKSIIGSQNLYQSETIIDLERGQELCIKQHPKEEGKITPAVSELYDQINKYNESVADKPWLKIRCEAIPKKNPTELRISYKQKGLLDQFNIARHNDIVYHDPKKMEISFEKETNTVMFSMAPGEADYSYEFESYLYASGFEYDYDREHGILSVDLSDEENREAFKTLMDAINFNKSENPGLADFFTKNFDNIPEELHKSGAQQFQFSVNPDDKFSEKEFGEWFDGNIKIVPQTVTESHESVKATVLEDGPETKYQRTTERTENVSTINADGSVQRRTDTDVRKDDVFKKVEPSAVNDAYVNPRYDDKTGSTDRAKGYLDRQIVNQLHKSEEDFTKIKEKIAAGEIPHDDSHFDNFIARNTAIIDGGKELDSAVISLDKAFEEGNVRKALDAFNDIKDKSDSNPEIRAAFSGEWLKTLHGDMLNMAEQVDPSLKSEIDNTVGRYADARIADEIAEKAAEERAGGEDLDRTSNLYDYTNESEEDFDEEFERSLLEEDHLEEEIEYPENRKEDIEEEYVPQFDNFDDAVDEKALKHKEYLKQQQERIRKSEEERRAAEELKVAEDRRAAEEARRIANENEEARKAQENRALEENRRREADQQAERDRAESLKREEELRREAENRAERDRADAARKADEDRKYAENNKPVDQSAYSSTGSYGESGTSSAGSSGFDPYATKEPYSSSPIGITPAPSSTYDNPSPSDYYKDTVTSPSGIDSSVGGWGSGNVNATPMSSWGETPSGNSPYTSWGSTPSDNAPAYEAPTYETPSYTDTDKTSNLYAESGKDYTDNYGQTQIGKDIDNYEDAKARQQQEQAQREAQQKAAEEERRKAADAQRRKEAEEQRRRQIMDDKRRHDEMEAAKKEAARSHAQSSGNHMYGVNDAYSTSIGSGSSIPSYSSQSYNVDVNVDRDYQINRATVENVHYVSDNSLDRLANTLAKPVTSHETLQAAEHNAVMKTAKDTAKEMLRSAMVAEATQMKIAGSIAGLQQSYQNYLNYGGSGSGLEKIKELNAGKLDERNLSGALVSGLSKDVAPLMKDINTAAYSLGFKGFKNISDFNELAKNPALLNQALRDLKKNGMSEEKLKQLKELAGMSKHADFVKNNMTGHGLLKGGIKQGLKSAAGSFNNSVRDAFTQTEAIAIGHKGIKNIQKAAKVNEFMLRAGVMALRNSSIAILRANAALRAARLRHGSLLGAVKAGGRKFVTGLKKLPGAVKSAPKIVRKAPRAIGRLAKNGAVLAKDGIKNGVKLSGRRVVAGVQRSLPVRMVKGGIRFGKNLRNNVRLIKKYGIKSFAQVGLKSMKGRMISNLKSRRKKFLDDLREWRKNFFKKLKRYALLIATVFAIFMVNILVIMLSQVGAAAGEFFKKAWRGFNEFRNDVEDPRNDTIIGIASEEMKILDVLYTEGISLFIGGLETIDDVVEKFPVIGPSVHNAAMTSLEAKAADVMDKNAYIMAKKAYYANTMISTHKSSSSQLGFTYFSDDRVGITDTYLERRKHITAQNAIFVECEVATLDDTDKIDDIVTYQNTAPQLTTKISDMSSINNSICLQFVDGNGNPSGRMTNIKEILSISCVVFTDAALGYRDFGDDQNFGIENGETISDKEIKEKAAEKGQEENISRIAGFIVFLGKMSDYLDSFGSTWNPLRMVADVIKEVIENLLYEIFPYYKGMPDIDKPGTAFIQGSYCLAAYFASHKLYIGYRADATTGGTMMINCDDKCMPHFGYTDPNNTKKDALDHNACEKFDIFYYRGSGIPVAAEVTTGFTDSFTFTEGWSISRFPSTYWINGDFASAKGYGGGNWNNKWCPFIYQPYVNDGNHSLRIYTTGLDTNPQAYQDALKKFMCLSAAKYLTPNDGFDGSDVLHPATTMPYTAYTCFGHPYIVVVAQTYTMHTGLFEIIESTPFLHSIESVMSYIDASMFSGQWALPKHWTDENREWAQWINDGDWEELYNLYVGNVMGAHYRIPTKLSVARIMLQLGPKTLSYERYYLLYKALRTVGHIAYGSATDMNKWVLYTSSGGAGFQGYRYGHDGIEAERPKIWAKQDQQGNPEYPDHLNNPNYIVWLFASSNLDILRRTTPPTESEYANLKASDVLSKCKYLGHGTLAPGDLVSKKEGTAVGQYARHIGIFVGYDSNREYGYVIEEYAFQFDVDESVSTEKDGYFPDTPTGNFVLRKGFKTTYSKNLPPENKIINAYGMVYLEKVKMSEWLGYRPKCYKYTPFNEGVDDSPNISFYDTYDAVESKRTSTGQWLNTTPGMSTQTYSSKDLQQQQYERWGKTH